MILDLPRTFKAIASKRYSDRYKIKRIDAINKASSIVMYTFMGSLLFFIGKNWRAPEDEEWNYVLGDWLSGPFGLWGKIGISTVDTASAFLDGGSGQSRAKYARSRFEPLLTSQADKALMAVGTASKSWARGDELAAWADTTKAVGVASGFLAGPTNFINHAVDWTVLASEQESAAMFLTGMTGVNTPKN
jgi:hypothetical protein